MLLQELDDLPDFLVAVLGADEEHIVSLYDNQIGHANRGHQQFRAIDDQASTLAANMLPTTTLPALSCGCSSVNARQLPTSLQVHVTGKTPTRADFSSTPISIGTL